MNAVVRDKSAPQLVAFKDIQQPSANDSQLLIKVEASSINRGELSLLNNRHDGWMPGQDFAGTVVASSSNKNDIEIGTRVVGLAQGGAWSEYLTVASTDATTLPEAVSFQEAAALPMAGLTAYRTIRKAGSLLGKSVLITAGGGGVGTYQTQIAALAGASVTSVIRDKELREKMRARLPGHEIISAIDKTSQQFDIIFESIGGEMLTDAIKKLKENGKIIMFGNTSEKKSSIDLFDFMPGHENGQLITYMSYADTAPIDKDLATLLDYVTAGSLQCLDLIEFPVKDIHEALAGLSDGSLKGKIILNTK
ncbi:MAG: oxidoreductase [Pedobacter sp.]|nr:MAG: oxidoreductase [Pedobacter sp.]